MAVQQKSASTAAVRYIGATLAEDSQRVVWYWDISQTEKRVLRFTVAEFPCADNTLATWGYFKLFKKAEDKEYRQFQQICCRMFEIEKLIGSLAYARDHVVGLQSSVKTEIPIDSEGKQKFDITDKEDEATVHWFFDVCESPKRKLRISYLMYQINDPIYSSYIQLKLFTRESMEDEFTRRFLLNMSYTEFTGLCFQVQGIRNEIQNAENAKVDLGYDTQ